MPFNVTNFSIFSPTQILNSAAPVVEQAVSTSAGTSLTLNLANGPYRDLLYQIYVENVGNVGGASVQLTLNGDTGNHYDYIRLDNGTPTAVQAGVAFVGLTSVVPATKHLLVSGRITDLAYTRNPGAGVRINSEGSSDAGAGFKQHLCAGHWTNSGAAVTSLTASMSAGSYGLMAIMAWGVQ